jgi:uncharacterized protein (DUF58 family)
VPRRASLTAAVLGATVLLTAGLFDAEPLYVPGVGLLLLAAASELIVIAGARGAAVHRELAAGRVLEGEPLSVRWRARTGLGPLAGATLEDPAAGDRAPTRIPPGRRTLVWDRTLTFPRRGRVRLAPARLVIRDPLGFARRTVSGSAEDRVLVLPRPEPVRAPLHRGAAEAGEDVGALAGAATEPDGLRPWRPGTPASRIFWPALARGRGLIERRVVPEADALPLIVVDSSAPESDEALDAAVRAAASLAVELGRGGGCAVLLPGDRRPTALRGLATWPALHARLALVASGPPPRFAEAVVRPPAVLWVQARVDQRPPPRATVLVQPGPLGARRPAFSVAGCQAYVVSSAAGVAA